MVNHHHGGETILVVEDEDLVRDVANRILMRNGYRVLMARGGSEALDVIASQGDQIDVLLTDVVMTGLNGNEIAERVVKLHPHIRVLYMSGYPEFVITSQGTIEPGVRLISKPFVEPELLDNVRRVLDE